MCAGSATRSPSWSRKPQHKPADAAELIEVDYEALPAVVSTAKATEPGAAKVWEGCADNICFVELIGDKAATDAAFAKAAHVVKHRFVINRVTAAAMEPRGAVGVYLPAEDRYIIHTPVQRAHPYRSEIAKVLKVAESKVRVICIDVGGSFGMKTPVFNEAPLTMFASKLTGRAVKWMSTRTEAFLSDAQARDNVTEAELALDKDGTFLGFRVKTIAAIGAYLQNNMPAFILNAGTLAGCYRTPAMYVDITGVFTNTNPVRPYRGNGRPEAGYVIERMVDLAAGELGLDPVELRRRNYISPAQMPFKTGLTFTYDSGEFEKNMDLALELADFKGFKRRREAQSRKRGKLRGFGISNTIERAAAGGTEGAEVRFDRGGSVTLFSGSVTAGQGHETVFKQLVCDRLGLHPNEVRYVQGDTDEVFYGEGTGGSRTSTMASAAFLMATDKVIEKAKAIAAFALKIDVADVNFADGVFSSPKTNRTMTIKEIAVDSSNPAKIPAAMEPGLYATAVYKAQVQNFPNGCHICELEIDKETGVVELVRYSVVDDVGTILNPMLLHGQIHGGVAQGAGQVLMEDIHFDASGQLVTASFMDYAMPHAHNLCNMEIESNPVPTKTNPMGTKGAGEAGNVGALPAVANALVDALAEFGVKHIEMPATAERIWRAMQR